MAEYIVAEEVFDRPDYAYKHFDNYEDAVKWRAENAAEISMYACVFVKRPFGWEYA